MKDFSLSIKQRYGFVLSAEKIQKVEIQMLFVQKTEEY